MFGVTAQVTLNLYDERTDSEFRIHIFAVKTVTNF